jgi:LPXTG-motif cell wall-anchored protein
MALSEVAVDTNTLLILLIALVILGGGGYYGRGRWF